MFSADKVEPASPNSAVSPWNADIAVSPERAAQRIVRQFPKLAPVVIEPFGAGWDNVAYRVNGAFVFRFPRRQIAVSLLENEARLLPHLTAHLPLPVPDPAWMGAGDDIEPTPFVGYRLLPGTTACRLNWTDDERASLAVPLAEFLRALHAIPINAHWAREAPGDTLHRADVAFRAPKLRERLHELAPTLAASDPSALLTTVDRLATTPLYQGTPVWVHGDLYARHLLIDNRRALSGIIDWGDLHRGDPALDLSIAFSFLPAAGDARSAFRAAYGLIDGDTWDRARFRALHYGAILTQYGAATGDEAILDAGCYALQAAGHPSLPPP